MCNWRAKSKEEYIRRCKLERIPEFAHLILRVHPVSAHELPPRTDVRRPELEHLAEQRQRHGVPRLPPPFPKEAGDDAGPPPVIVVRLDEVEQLELALGRRRRPGPHVGGCHNLPEQWPAVVGDEGGEDDLVAAGSRTARGDGGLESGAAEAFFVEEDLHLLPHGVAGSAAAARAGLLSVLLLRRRRRRRPSHVCSFRPAPLVTVISREQRERERGFGEAPVEFEI